MKKTKRRCNIIAPSVILPFDGNHADIPSGYTRETSLDNKYIKGTANGTNPNTTGGASTHSHSSPSHSHTLVNHTHTYNTSNGSNYIIDDGSGSSGANNADEIHTHNGSTSGGVSGGTISGSATIGTGVNDPPYYTVIFIKSIGYSTIPNNAMVFSVSTTRSGFSFHSASANKFLKGAGTGANAGSTGGALTHTHTYNHTHSTANHSHVSANSAEIASNYRQSWGAANDQEATSDKHTHSVSLDSSSSNTVNTISASFTSSTVEPAYKTLNAFKNTSGSGKMPAVGDIALWLGTLATIPIGWKLCDGSNGTPDMRGRYYKNPSSASASSTGGANTHVHTGVASHSHTATGTHTHTGICPATTMLSYVGGNGHSKSKKTHTHTLTDISSVTASWNSTTISTNEVSNEPEYRTVAFIQFEFPPVIPNPILMMMVDSPENV